MSGKVPELAGYETLKREVKYGKNSRIDILLSDPERGLCYVEVKNVHLKRDEDVPGLAEFPDAVTARGAKHLDEMGVKGKLGGSWTSSMVLRTCRYEFHETRRMFEHPEWWGSEPSHDSVDFTA